MASISRQLYALAASLDLVDNNSSEDPFHQLVYGLTGKEHVSELASAEAKKVQAELQERMRLKNFPNRISVPQQKLVWRLIYRLCELEPTAASPVERLIGAIKKILNTSASKSEPFYWVKSKDDENRSPVSAIFTQSLFFCFKFPPNAGQNANQENNQQSPAVEGIRHDLQEGKISIEIFQCQNHDK